jgi:hypothetical protein
MWPAKKDFPPLNPNAGQIRTISRFQLDEVFLLPFSEAEPRKTLIDKFNFLLDELETANTPVEIWVNGSFSTLKNDPGDIDLFVILDRKLLLEPKAKKLSVFLDHDFCRSRYSCDLYWGFRDDTELIERFRGVYTKAHIDLKPKGFFRIYLNAA